MLYTVTFSLIYSVLIWSSVSSHTQTVAQAASHHSVTYSEEKSFCELLHMSSHTPTIG